MKKLKYLLSTALVCVVSLSMISCGTSNTASTKKDVSLTISAAASLKEAMTYIEPLFKEKYPNKTIWLYTGDSWEEIRFDPIMKYIDVLIDGEFKMEERDVTLYWKGSRNQRVIDVKKSLEQEATEVPVIYCDDYKNEGADYAANCTVSKG